MKKSALFEHFSQLLIEPVGFNDLKEPFPTFFLRLDYYLSCVSQVSKIPIVDLIEKHFKKDLKSYLQYCYFNGYIGNFGHTVDISSYILNFPSTNISLIWIPKNSCTSVKSMLMAFEPSELTGSINRHLFHEGCQKVFGLNKQMLVNNLLFPLISIIRHPYERIISCYLDKFANPVIKRKNFEPFILPHIKNAFQLLGIEDRKITDSITFYEFIWYVFNTPAWSWDSHWRPQYCFLGGLSKDIRLIPMDRLDKLSSIIGVNNNITNLNESYGGFYEEGVEASEKYQHLLPSELENLSLDNYNSFLSLEIINMINILYEKDEALYKIASISAK